jgi:hypothetical protein
LLVVHTLVCVGMMRLAILSLTVPYIDAGQARWQIALEVVDLIGKVDLSEREMVFVDPVLSVS